jgi:hypothetical protein
MSAPNTPESRTPNVNPKRNADRLYRNSLSVPLLLVANEP